MGIATSRLARATAIVATVLSASVGLAGPASAADTNHTNETIIETIGPFHDTFGFNPCTGEDDTGYITLTFHDQFEDENGNYHGDLNGDITVHVDNGFVANWTDQVEESFDAAGNGTVEVQAEIVVSRAATNESFVVTYTQKILFVEGTPVWFGGDGENVGPCERG